MKKGSTGLLVLILAVVLMGAAAMYFMVRSAEVSKDSRNIPPAPIAGVGELISVTGEVVCLLHKDQGERQTSECAVGVGVGAAYFGLLDPTPDYSFISKLDVGEQITVAGILHDVPAENKYVSTGVIEIQTIEPVMENNKL